MTVGKTKTLTKRPDKTIKGQRADSGGPDFSPLTVCLSTHSQTMSKQADRRLTYAHTDKVARVVFKTSVSVFPADTTDCKNYGRRSLQFRGQWHDLHTVTDELKTKMTENVCFDASSMERYFGELNAKMI